MNYKKIYPLLSRTEFDYLLECLHGASRTTHSHDNRLADAILFVRDSIVLGDTNSLVKISDAVLDIQKEVEGNA